MNITAFNAPITPRRLTKAVLGAVLLAWMMATPPVSAFAADACESTVSDVPGKSSLGSAAAWANLRGSDGSLKKESKRLIDEALKRRTEIKAPELSCPTGCEASPLPLLVFKSAPNKFLSDYHDAKTCDRLHAQTKSSPHRYDGNVFSSVDDLNSWFSDFSQGKGKQGSDLYEKCPGNCSPQYTNVIDVQGSKYSVRAEAVCGPARDKDDNQYKLSVAYRFTCKAKS